MGGGVGGVGAGVGALVGALVGETVGAAVGGSLAQRNDALHAKPGGHDKAKPGVQEGGKQTP